MSANTSFYFDSLDVDTSQLDSSIPHDYLSFHPNHIDFDFHNPWNINAHCDGAAYMMPSDLIRLDLAANEPPLQELYLQPPADARPLPLLDQSFVCWQPQEAEQSIMHEDSSCHAPPTQPPPISLTERPVRRGSKIQKLGPAMCTVLDCQGLMFKNDKSLKRHLKEVHPTQGSKLFFCRVQACPRSKRGFNRPYRVIDHVNRCHKPDTSNAQTGARSCTTLASDETASDDEELNAADSENEPGLPDANGTKVLSLDQAKRTLEQHLEMRRMLDKDIEHWKYMVTIMGDGRF